MASVADQYLGEILANAVVRRKLDVYQGARVLVTGGSGIVGLGLLRILADLGADVVGHSRTAYARGISFAGQRVSWIHGALEDFLGKAGSADYVFHCATFGQPEKFSREWRDTIRLNADSLFRALDLGKKVGFASTTEVYSGLVDAATEDMIGTTTPQHPRSSYIEAKRLGEAICFHAGSAISNRVALASGPVPKADDSRAIYQIIRRGLRERRISLQGGGSNIRQYQYSLACAARFLVTTAHGTQPVYNNAGPYVVSMTDLAQAVASCLGVPFAGGSQGDGLAGAPGVVSISMTRFQEEFPDLRDLDPSFEFFVRAVVEASDAQC